MYPVVFIVTAFRTCAAVELALGNYLLQLVRPLLAGLIMYATVYFLTPLAYSAAGQWVYLLQLVLIGSLTYGAAMLLIDRSSVTETIALLRS